MKTRNQIWTLVAVATLLFATSASAQSKGKLFEGASTYYLEVLPDANCDLSENFIREKALFPLSSSRLKQGEPAEADVWISVEVGADIGTNTGACYGFVGVTANAILWSATIPFNKKNSYASIRLFQRRTVFLNHDRSEIGTIVEDLVKLLVTSINLDNQ